MLSHVLHYLEHSALGNMALLLYLRHESDGCENTVIVFDSSNIHHEAENPVQKHRNVGYMCYFCKNLANSTCWVLLVVKYPQSYFSWI